MISHNLNWAFIHSLKACSWLIICRISATSHSIHLCLSCIWPSTNHRLVIVSLYSIYFWLKGRIQIIHNFVHWSLRYHRSIIIIIVLIYSEIINSFYFYWVIACHFIHVFIFYIRIDAILIASLTFWLAVVTRGSCVLFILIPFS